MEKEIFEIVIRVAVNVEAETREEAEQIAQDNTGVCENAPDTIKFVWAELM